MRIPAQRSQPPRRVDIIRSDGGSALHFNFDGFDESAIGYHPEYGPLIHKSKFYAWIGYDPTHNTRTSERHHMGKKDLVKGVFSPIGGITRGGRKADALTVRGVRRILLRSDHPRAREYADRVLDVLDDLATKGMVIDEKNITTAQIDAGQETLEALRRKRLEEKSDYKSILHSLKLGGAVSEDYRAVQETLYIRLFGMTAARIRMTQPQRTGERLKNGTGFTKASSGIAKNYLDERQLKLLNNTVLATVAQIDQHHPEGATARQMIDAVNRAADLTCPQVIAA